MSFDSIYSHNHFKPKLILFQKTNFATVNVYVAKVIAHLLVFEVASIYEVLINMEQTPVDSYPI